MTQTQTGQKVAGSETPFIPLYTRVNLLLLPTKVASAIVDECREDEESSSWNKIVCEPQTQSEKGFFDDDKETTQEKESPTANVRRTFSCPDVEIPKGYRMRLYSPDAILARYKKLDALTGDDGEQRKIMARLDDLRSRGTWRRLASIPENWHEIFDQLEVDHPNFVAVIDYLRGVCAVAERSDSVPRPVNLLLNGPPGCGKTYFAKKLAKCFDTEFHAIHLESIQTAGEIVGDSDSYRNAAPGMLFNYLTGGKVGNPIILLDEICKLNGDERFSPQSALLRILEKETAKAFTDNAENWCVLDLSRTFFVATSNTLDTISAPIRSRLKTFEIAMPLEPKKIIHNIFDGVVASNIQAFAGFTLSDAAVEVLLTQSPRRIRQLVEDAMSAALYKGRNTVLKDDIGLEFVKPVMGF